MKCKKCGKEMKLVFLEYEDWVFDEFEKLVKVVKRKKTYECECGHYEDEAN
jgi:hypothetical protein